MSDEYWQHQYKGPQQDDYFGHIPPYSNNSDYWQHQYHHPLTGNMTTSATKNQYWQGNNYVMPPRRTKRR